MTRKRRRTLKGLAAGLLPWTLFVAAACDTIDDDRSDCTTVEYEVRLTTSLRTQLQTELQTELTTEMSAELQASLREIGARLEAELADVFSDYAHDVDLSFYVADGSRKHHDRHIMDANQATYTLAIDLDDYRHLAVANSARTHIVTLADDGALHTAKLAQLQADTIDSHETGLFSARKHISIEQGVSQTFNVTLYMQNSAAVLIVDPGQAPVDEMWGYLGGLADGFLINDSTYTFGRNTCVRTLPLGGISSTQRCLYGVGFPSRDSMATPAPASATAPSVAPALVGRSTASAPGLWQYILCVRLADGSVTRSVIDVPDPLQAGHVRVLRAVLDANGGVGQVPNHEVGISVTLDWDEGMHFHSDL